jgi:DNA-binding NarL/FixJ family response regulator
LCRSEKIDCVVLSYDLPDIPALRLLLQLVSRPRCPEIAVICLIWPNIPYMAQLLRKNGAQACLPKTHTGEQITTAIQKAIAAAESR